MKTIPVRRICATLLLMWAPVGNAVVEFVGLDPTAPYGGESISMILYSDGCDYLQFGQEVSISGHMIRAIVDGALASDPFCMAPPSEIGFPIGSFDAGTWVLQIDYRHNDPTSPGDTVIETIDTITFDVLPAPGGNTATPVPVIGLWGVGGLVLGLLAIAAGVVRRRPIRTL